MDEALEAKLIERRYNPARASRRISLEAAGHAMDLLYHRVSKSAPQVILFDDTTELVVRSGLVNIVMTKPALVISDRALGHGLRIYNPLDPERDCVYIGNDGEGYILFPEIGKHSGKNHIKFSIRPNDEVAGSVTKIELTVTPKDGREEADIFYIPKVVAGVR